MPGSHRFVLEASHGIQQSKPAQFALCSTLHRTATICRTHNTACSLCIDQRFNVDADCGAGTIPGRDPPYPAHRLAGVKWKRNRSRLPQEAGRGGGCYRLAQHDALRGVLQPALGLPGTFGVGEAAPGQKLLGLIDGTRWKRAPPALNWRGSIASSTVSPGPRPSSDACCRGCAALYRYRPASRTCLSCASKFTLLPARCPGVSFLLILAMCSARQWNSNPEVKAILSNFDWAVAGFVAVLAAFYIYGRFRPAKK